MKKNLTTLLLLTLLGMLALIPFHLAGRRLLVAENAPCKAPHQVTTPAATRGHNTQVAPQESPQAPSSAARSWTPPGAFAKTGKPVPALVFPRGENASRRYHKVVSRDIDPAHSSTIPAVLAKSPEDGRFHLLPEEIDEHTLVAARMVFDPTALDQIVNGTTSRLLAPTPDGKVLTLEFKKIKTRSAQTHTLQGHVVGEENTSLVQIVYHDGILHGSVMRYASQKETEYHILADGYMMVRELDTPSMTAGCEQPPENNEDAMEARGIEVGQDAVILNSEGVIQNSTVGWRTVDVAVGYDQEARIADGGYAQIEARIIASVDRMTAAFANSGIADAEVMLLGTIEDPDYRYSDSSATNMGAEIAALRTETDGPLDTVTDFSNRLGADFVSFVILQSRGGTAGVASAGKYTVVARTYMTPGRIVFAHELGHNLGCTHAWSDTNHNVDNSRYGWRFQSPDTGNRYATIMAYDGGWGGATIPYYSNPNIFYDGARTGAVNGYNVLGDATADQQFYFEGGFYGFDGTHPDLGANNAQVIDDGDALISTGLTYNAARSTRNAFSVLSPVAAAQWERGTTQTISFNGGDMQDLVTIKLYKGGALHSILASDVNPVTNRNFQWTVPFSIANGTDYMIRVELTSNGSTLFQDSGIFTIFSLLPHVTAQATTAIPAGIGAISQLALTFNVPMDPATFSAGSDIVTFIDPTGTSVAGTITGTSWSAGDTVLTIQFTPPSLQGSYQIAIGPDIADTAGNKMDQDDDGTTGESVDDRFTMTFHVNPPLPYYAGMDTDPGWTFSANNPGPGWAFGQPTGGSGQSPETSYPANNYNAGYGIADPTSGFNGPNVIGYNLNGDYERGITSTRWATTPAMNCSNYGNVRLRFQRWLGVYYGSSVYGGTLGDNAYIVVSNNGTTWTPVWHNTSSRLTSAGWVEVEYDISAVADGQSTVYVRWGMGNTNTSLNDDSCGWNIDEVVVHGDYVDNSDITPPYPSPLSFASPPTALGVSAITMTASTALDANGVEYFFDETSGNPGGTDSAWQDSPTYTDTGLQLGTQYTYTVKARDKSPHQNEAVASSAASATTDASATLTLVIAAASVSESGGTGATTTAVRRNTDTTNSLVVNLSSSDTTEATAPATVTIAAGQSTSPAFNVNAVDDAIVDGTQNVTLTATAAGHANGSDSIEVTDDLPLTLTVVTGANGASTSGGGLKDPDGNPFAITASAASGYRFSQWTVTSGDASFGNQASASTTVDTAGDATVQANFVLTTYAVTYAGNGSDGGSVPVDASSPYDLNSTVTVLGNTGSLTRSGYSFADWNTASNGGGTSYAGGDSFSITEDIILYAQWTPTIALGNLSQVYDGTPKSASVTTDPAGLSHTITYDGAATAPTNAGTYAVVATITEPGYSGSASGNLVIAKASQTITFDPLGSVALSGTPIPLTATASSGLAVSYSSSNTEVATVSGSDLTTVASGTSIITASQAGDSNYNAATSVQQTLTVSLIDPLADAGGPYKLYFGGSPLSLDGSGSQASHSATITTYAWDLDGNLDYEDATGANPTAISYNDLVQLWSMEPGLNTIRLQVTDSAGKSATSSTTVELIDGLTWDANAGGSGLTDGGAAWLDANQWWDGVANTNWSSGSVASFGNGGTGGNVTLASPTSLKSLTFNSFTGTYNLGTSGQTLTIEQGITLSSASGAVTLTSPLVLSASQTWTNNASNGALQLLVNGAVDNGGFDLTIGGTSVAPDRSTGNVRIVGTLSGAGGLFKNGPGVLWLQAASTHGGPTTVNGGILRNQVNSLTGLPSGNITLNGGVLEAYWGDTFTRSLGTGTNQIQITGGASGFSQNAANTLNVKLGNTNTPIQWGSTYFNPTKLILQEYTGNTNALTNFQNYLDLNGSNRTVEVNGNPLISANAQISGIISNSTGTGGLIKTGNGLLTLTATNTYNGDTTVSAGTLRINVANANNQPSTLSIAAGATLHLGFTGTDTVDKLFVDGVQLAAGTYKAVGSAASGTKLDQLAGTGTLTVTSSPPPPGPGPVDHFTISSIASPQTVGTPITGITITAQDTSNNTATSFTGTVEFGGTAGITGTSASFVDGVISGVSITPTSAGTDKTLTVADDSSHAGSATFTVQTRFQDWAGSSGLTGSDAEPGSDPDGDNLTNLQEFAFGMDPTSPVLNPLSYVLNDTTTPGIPILENTGTLQSPDFRAVFARRKDHLAAGLTYEVQFSANLTYWKSINAGLSILSGTSASAVEAVAVPFPATVPLTAAETEHAAPKFFRLAVTPD